MLSVKKQKNLGCQTVTFECERLQKSCLKQWPLPYYFLSSRRLWCSVSPVSSALYEASCTAAKNAADEVRVNVRFVAETSRGPEQSSPVRTTFFHGNGVKMQNVVTVFRILIYRKRHTLYNFYIRKSGTMWAIHRCSSLKNPDLRPFTTAATICSLTGFRCRYSWLTRWRLWVNNRWGLLSIVRPIVARAVHEQWLAVNVVHQGINDSLSFSVWTIIARCAGVQFKDFLTAEQPTPELV